MCFVKKRLTWGKTSGRDSKMTSRTPMGTVNLVSSSPSASRVRRITRPTIDELLSAICLNPSERILSLGAVKVSRPLMAAEASEEEDSFSALTSLWLARRISLSRSIKRSARVRMTADRWSPVRAWSCLPPSRAEIHKRKSSRNLITNKTKLANKEQDTLMNQTEQKEPPSALYRILIQSSKGGELLGIDRYSSTPYRLSRCESN